MGSAEGASRSARNRSQASSLSQTIDDPEALVGRPRRVEDQARRRRRECVRVARVLLPARGHVLDECVGHGSNVPRPALVSV